MTRTASCLKYLALILLLALACCRAAAQAPVYADPASWACFESALQPDRPADVFLVAPTVDMGPAGSMSLESKKLREKFTGALNMERGIYGESAACFAPYYRQASFGVYKLPQGEAEKYFTLAYGDVKSAFKYYLKNHNQNRPLILAGFSQGADMVLRLLKDREIGRSKKLRQNLVAAYAIGWRLTEEDVQSHPWLQPAQGALDSGVIIAFNTEAPYVTESLPVPKGVRTLAINPLNWRTDGTPATRRENLGACFIDYSGRIVKEVPHISGGYLDRERGTLKLPYIEPSEYKNALFPDGVYHLYDYQFCYRNLQQNVAARTQAFLARRAEAAK